MGERALVGMSEKHWGRAEAIWRAMSAFADQEHVPGVDEALRSADIVGWQYAIDCPLKGEKRWILTLCATEQDARQAGMRRDPSSGELLECLDVRPLRSALAAKPIANADWVMVPREPTEAMLAASEREWDGRMSFRSTGAWQAMLSASPAHVAVSDDP